MLACAVVELAFKLRSLPKFTAGSDMDVVTARGLGTLLMRHGHILSTEQTFLTNAITPRIQTLFQKMQPFIGTSSAVGAMPRPEVHVVVSMGYIGTTKLAHAAVWLALLNKGPPAP